MGERTERIDQNHYYGKRPFWGNMGEANQAPAKGVLRESGRETGALRE